MIHRCCGCSANGGRPECWRRMAQCSPQGRERRKGAQLHRSSLMSPCTMRGMGGVQKWCRRTVRKRRLSGGTRMTVGARSRPSGMRSALTVCSANGLGDVVESLRRRRRAFSAAVDAGKTRKDAVICWAFPCAGAPTAPAQRRANGVPHSRSYGGPWRTSRPGAKSTETGH